MEGGIEAEELLPEPETPVREGEKKVRGKAEWNQRYKLARSYLYGSERIPQDFAEAMRLFLAEADSGNVLAMYDLGRMWADSLGVEAAPDTAQEWYRKALAAFLSAEKELPERKKTYLQYRIGKMYLAGLGTTQDHGTAVAWLKQAVLTEAYTDPLNNNEITKAYQNRVPRQGEIPTPEEAVRYLAGKVKKNRV